MMQDGGGLSAVSFGISETLVSVVIVAIVVIGLWKLATLIWTAFSG